MQKNCAKLSSCLQTYFEDSVGSRLLYSSEQDAHQKHLETIAGSLASSKGPKDLCDIYGGEHLLRLIVKLPEFLLLCDKSDRLLAQEQATLQITLDHLIRWLSKRTSKKSGLFGGYQNLHAN